jgi:ArsR family transcriptional regulator
VTASKVLDPEQVDTAFKALASEQRREILRMLAECTPDDTKTCRERDEVCACKISERLRLAPSTISHHMAILRAAGLVTARKDGTWVHYSLKRDVVRGIASELLGI